MQRYIKNSLFICILLFLFVFLCQYKLNFVHLKPLNGASAKKEKPALSINSWFSGEYQKQFEDFFNEEFGFRTVLVKLNHEIDFLCFKKAHAAWVIVGKKNYIYESGYIDAYYGKDYIGEEKINNYLRQIKQIQDTLKKRNKLFLLVFAPGKASFYPEFIPDKYKTDIHPISNYKAFSKKAEELHLDYIDFNSYFMAQKDKSKYPLYPQYGIHWSSYGAVNAFDSILHYTEKKLSVLLPQLTIHSFDYTDTLRDADNDLVQGMNLLWKPHTFKMAYPNYTTTYDSTKHKKLNSLVISDSFWWQIYGAGLPKSIFANYNFWYYNKEMYPESSGILLHVGNADYYTRLRNTDVIILMHTEATLARFGFNFVDMCYQTFCQKQDTIKEKIQQSREAIVKTPDWFNKVKKSAEEKNIPIDSEIYLNAKWMAEH